MWTVEYKLMLALGGKDYQQEAKVTAHAISLFFQGRGKIPSYKDKANVLGACFGISPSSEWKTERGNTFLTYCALMAADLYWDQETAVQLKYQILQHGMSERYKEQDCSLEKIRK